MPLDSYKTALLKARKIIVDNVTDVGPLVDSLADGLNSDELESIKSITNRKEKVRHLLDILSCRSKLVPRLYSALVIAEETVAANALVIQLPELKVYVLTE